MYNLSLNNKVVGQGLSFGELNQWLIDLDKELDVTDKEVFRKNLGVSMGASQVDFEEFIYSNKPNTPLKLKFGNSVVLITEE